MDSKPKLILIDPKSYYTKNEINDKIISLYTECKSRDEELSKQVRDLSVKINVIEKEKLNPTDIEIVHNTTPLFYLLRFLKNNYKDDDYVQTPIFHTFFNKYLVANNMSEMIPQHIKIIMESLGHKTKSIGGVKNYIMKPS